MKLERRMEQVLCCVVLILLALVVLVSVLWTISVIFKTEAQTYLPKPQWILDPVSLESFHKFFTTYNFGRMTPSSLATRIFTVTICVTCACLVGYGATRFQFRDKKQLMDFLLVTQMLPGVMLMVPFYAVPSKYYMTNKLIGLIIVYTTIDMVLSIRMPVSYFRTVLIELDETTRVDRTSSFRTFWDIILPLTVPGTVAVAIFVPFSG